MAPLLNSRPLRLSLTSWETRAIGLTSRKTLWNGTNFSRFFDSVSMKMCHLKPQFDVLFFSPSRDRKRKRFVRETGKDNQKKKIKTDGGQVISHKKNKKNLYPSNKMLLCVLLLLLLTPCNSLTMLSCCITWQHVSYEEWKKKYKVDDTGSGSDGETGGRGGRKPAGGRTASAL